MDDKPFVTIKRAGSVKINDNDTGGSRLLDAEDVDGEVEVLRNTGASTAEIPPNKPWWKRSIYGVSNLVVTIIGGVVSGVVLAWLGITGNVPW